MRVTKKLLESEIEILNLKMETRHFYLDKNATGYALSEKTGKGARKISDRTSAKELYTYIQGILTGIKYFKQKEGRTI